MNMVRHHHPRTELVEAPFVLSDQNGLSHQVRDVRVPQPLGTDRAPVQGAVLNREGMTGSGAPGGVYPERQCPPEAPSQEHVSVPRMKMRQSSAVLGHAWRRAGGTACPTKSSAPIGPTISQKCKNSRRRHECRRGTHECVRHRAGSRSVKLTLIWRQPWE